MAGKVLSLLPPFLLAAAGLCGLLLLCVPTRDVREPPALKVPASARGTGGALGQAAPAWLPTTPARALLPTSGVESWLRALRSRPAGWHPGPLRSSPSLSPSDPGGASGDTRS